MKNILVLTVFLLSIGSTAYSQVTAASALIVLDEINASVSEHLNTIDNLKTNAIGDGGNMILSLVSRLKKDINETISNTDKVLRENQLNIYNQVINLNSEFNKTIENNIENIDVVVTKITQTAQDLIIKKKEPNIFKYVTETFIQGYSKDYTLIVKGNNFNRSNNIYIQLNGKKVSPKQISFSELVFKINPENLNPKSDSERYIEANIIFEWEKGLFKKDIKDIEPFIIPIIPYNIGIATVYYEQEKPERKYSATISYSCSCGTGTSGWDGGREKSSTTFNVLPTNGRMIDPNTVTVTSWSQRYGGGKTFQHKTEQQIKGYITCNSEAKPKGGGGHSSITFTYKEYEIIHKQHKNQTNKTEINSANPLLFELPAPIGNKRPNVNYVKIETYDNKTIMLVPNEANKYFKLSINPVTDDISISWKN